MAAWLHGFAHDELTFLESPSLILLGDFQSSMGNVGVQRPVLLGILLGFPGFYEG